MLWGPTVGCGLLVKRSWSRLICVWILDRNNMFVCSLLAAALKTHQCFCLVIQMIHLWKRKPVLQKLHRFLQCAAVPQDIFVVFQTLLPPPAELSPGLAALTVGCDSGNLGSLSRVQLLLLDRMEPETLPSPFSQEEEFSPVQDWFDLRMQYDQGLTSAGKGSWHAKHSERSTVKH